MHRKPAPDAPPLVSPEPRARRTTLAVKISCLALFFLVILLATAAFNSGFHLLDLYRSCYFPPCYAGN